MNIYDVSRKAGVSIATVSRVLNGSPNVSERTRTLVLEIMEQLGYTPNVFARGLGLGSIQTIGIMCSDSSDPYLSHAIYYLEQGLLGSMNNIVVILRPVLYELGYCKNHGIHLFRTEQVKILLLCL